MASKYDFKDGDIVVVNGYSTRMTIDTRYKDNAKLIYLSLDGHFYHTLVGYGALRKVPHI